MQAEIGSISSGTMRSEDLIPTFVAELERLDDAGEFNRVIGEANNIAEEDYNSEDVDVLDDIDIVLQDLFDALGALAPPYTGFGAHPGDGADYGFWPDIDALEDDARYGVDVVKVNDHSEIPEGWTGYVMLVNDHGNVTLLTPVTEFKEVWGAV